MNTIQVELSRVGESISDIARDLERGILVDKFKALKSSGASEKTIRGELGLNQHEYDRLNVTTRKHNHQELQTSVFWDHIICKYKHTPAQRWLVDNLQANHEYYLLGKLFVDSGLLDSPYKTVRVIYFNDLR